MSDMIEASPITTRHGQAGTTGLLRYLLGSATALGLLFGMFLLAGFQF
ncbi:hypothetical protein ACFQY5_08855 [Paeniroseomonas aquatica]|uniref:Uncharacterized protein n=1 Tax=Paeniroseomonas aquatica TaxID=373043 RepID=A0ABT8A6B8_9PROT|nr:hypothetical protein [Paeniroseomonas aquatica]MDN3565124.1 hypothetical protein [Paeniroseomonas aquatica]